MFKHIFLITFLVAGCTTWNPPAEYDHAFHGREEILRLPPENVGPSCRAMFDWAGFDIETTDRQRGCAVVVNDVCYIITIDRIFENTAPISVIRHERGHCNGWPESHPN